MAPHAHAAAAIRPSPAGVPVRTAACPTRAASTADHPLRRRSAAGSTPVQRQRPTRATDARRGTTCDANGIHAGPHFASTNRRGTSPCPGRSVKTPACVRTSVGNLGDQNRTRPESRARRIASEAPPRSVTQRRFLAPRRGRPPPTEPGVGEMRDRPRPTMGSRTFPSWAWVGMRGGPSEAARSGARPVSAPTGTLDATRHRRVPGVGGSSSAPIRRPSRSLHWESCGTRWSVGLGSGKPRDSPVPWVLARPSASTISGAMGADLFAGSIAFQALPFSLATVEITFWT